MPVGTKGTVKSLDPLEVRGARRGDPARQHVPPALPPGDELIRDLGGLHAFMAWDGPILTDSGGFQVFSLRDTIARVDDDGVTFRSVYDGRETRFTPELAAGHPGQPRQRHRDVPRPGAGRRRHSPRARGSRPAHDRVGGAPAPRAAGRGPVALRDQPGRGRPRASPALDRGDRRARLRRQRDRRARDRRGARGDVRGDRPRGGDAAGGQAALLHGHRRPRGHPRGDRGRRRHVRLRPADPNGAHRQRAHAQQDASTCGTPASPATRLRSTTSATARPARASAAPTSAISSTRTSYWDCACSRSTIYASSCN